jgi:hypothetical protein
LYYVGERRAEFGSGVSQYSIISKALVGSYPHGTNGGLQNLGATLLTRTWSSGISLGLFPAYLQYLVLSVAWLTAVRDLLDGNPDNRRTLLSGIVVFTRPMNWVEATSSHLIQTNVHVHHQSKMGSAST